MMIICVTVQHTCWCLSVVQHAYHRPWCPAPLQSQITATNTSQHTHTHTHATHTHLCTQAISSFSLMMLPSFASNTARVWPTACFFRNFFRPGKATELCFCVCWGEEGVHSDGVASAVLRNQLATICQAIVAACQGSAVCITPLLLLLLQMDAFMWLTLAELALHQCSCCCKCLCGVVKLAECLELDHLQAATETPEEVVLSSAAAM